MIDMEIEDDDEEVHTMEGCINDGGGGRRRRSGRKKKTLSHWKSSRELLGHIITLCPTLQYFLAFSETSTGTYILLIAIGAQAFS